MVYAAMYVRHGRLAATIYAKTSWILSLDYQMKAKSPMVQANTAQPLDFHRNRITNKRNICKGLTKIGGDWVNGRLDRRDKFF